ncbi:MAG: hypothetical protein AAGF47_11540 [Planctomycetota bacterium]
MNTNRLFRGLVLAAVAGAAALADQAAAQPTHELLLTNGNTVKVELVREDSRELEVKVYFGAMAAPRTFQRSEIISITMLDASGGVPADAAAATRPVEVASTADALPEGSVPVFVFELAGQFGRDISYTPVKNAMDAAREAGAEVVVVKFNNNWRSINEEFTDERYDDEGNFDEVFTAEQIEPVFTSELIADWREQPKVVFWVERAMSGMAFLPLLKNDVFFTSDGRMGGVGNLDDLFGGTGDEVVRDKQESLRLARVEGMTISGGHDPAIVRAMTRESVELWYKLEFGRPVFFETITGEVPEGPGWVQLTDDGQDENQDTDRQIVRGLANDTLTMNAETAFKIGFSKGTVDSLDDLFFELGIDDRAVVLADEDESGVSDPAERAMDRWSQGLTRAIRTLRRLEQDIANIRPPQIRNDPGGVRARNAVRSQEIQLLDRAIRLYTQYAEVLDPNEQARANLALRKQQIENTIRRERIGGGG